MAMRTDYMSDAELKALSLGECEATHPGFDVKCQKCGSQHVIVQSSLGFSETSGGWGSVDLRCVNCDNVTEIVES